MNGEAWGVNDAAALVDAIKAELGEIVATDSELIKKGRLTAPEAQYRKELVGEILGDLIAAFDGIGSYVPSEAMSKAWANKVRWIERELEDRKRDYPELVKKGRMTEANARARIRALKALRRLYWEKLFMWSPPPGPGLEYLKALQSTVLSSAPSATREQLRQSEGTHIYRELVRRHMATVELELEGQGRLVA